MGRGKKNAAGWGENVLDRPRTPVVPEGMRVTPFHTIPYRGFFAFALFATLVLPLLLTGCASGGVAGRYKYRSVKSILPGGAVRAAAPIDGYGAYVVYFRLGKPVRALTIGISAEYVADITGVKKYKKTYFIVEKIVDIPRGGGRATRRLYPELGRNYSPDWNREKDITVRSITSEPFRGLDAAHPYQIRYTAFTEDAYYFTITVEADEAVTFIDAIE